MPGNWTNKLDNVMNTKTDGISSGLVAEFWLSIDCIGERYLCFSKPQDDDELHPLVRLSYAEAVISKQAERIKELEEQCRTNHSMEIDSLSRKCDKQSAALKLAREALDDGAWKTDGNPFAHAERVNAALAAIDALGE